MYRKDILLETTDMRLRLFVEYCKLLQPYYEDAYVLNQKLIDYGVIRNNGAILRSRRFKNIDYSDSKLIDLIDKEDAAWKRYNTILIFVNDVVKDLQKLDTDSINVLYLRYERKLTLRNIGDIIGYSYMQVSRIIDDILIKFE